MKHHENPVPDQKPTEGAEGTVAAGHPEPQSRPSGSSGDRPDQPHRPRLFRATVHDSCGPVATRVTARKIPAGEVQLRWRACGLDLATPGRIVVMRDVSALGASLAQLGICAMYGMSADGLIDVAFAPTALQASAPQASPRLRSMAALAGVDPATLIDWHLAASGLPPALGTPGQGQEP